jgi:hypothetical protein
MNDKLRLQVSRTQILDTVTAVENKTGKMFHDIQPETDTEIYGAAWYDRKRLDAIKYSLQSYYEL